MIFHKLIYTAGHLHIVRVFLLVYYIFICYKPAKLSLYCFHSVCVYIFYYGLEEGQTTCIHFSMSKKIDMQKSVCLSVCVCVCVSGPFALPFLSGAFDHEGVDLEQPFLACRFITNCRCEKWPAWPPLSVRLSVSPSDQNPQDSWIVNDFTHGNDFWCAGSWDTHKEKNDPHDHLCQSVSNSSESHQNSKELLTMIEFTYDNDFWCTCLWNTHKEKNYLHDHLCPSVCNSSESHQNPQELLTVIELT